MTSSFLELAHNREALRADIASAIDNGDPDSALLVLRQHGEALRDMLRDYEEPTDEDPVADLEEIMSEADDALEEVEGTLKDALKYIKIVRKDLKK